MARHPLHPNATSDPVKSRRSQWLFAAASRERLRACDDDDSDEDWDRCEGDPATGPMWDPLELDDEEPQPEYGDFWDDPDDFED